MKLLIMSLGSTAYYFTLLQSKYSPQHPVGYYNELQKYTFDAISVFGSNHFCEQVFQNVNYIKTKLRDQLSVESLGSCLKVKVTFYNPKTENLQ
jgi:hypothetical protein